MLASFRIGMVLMLLCSLGCSGSVGQTQTGEPGDPQASDVLLAHWEALHRGDWRAAYDCIHPDLKAAGLTLKRFTALHARRLKMNGAPQSIEIAGSEQTGDDVVAHTTCARRQRAPPSQPRYCPVAKRPCGNRAARGH